MSWGYGFIHDLQSFSQPAYFGTYQDSFADHTPALQTPSYEPSFSTAQSRGSIEQFSQDSMLCPETGFGPPFSGSFATSNNRPSHTNSQNMGQYADPNVVHGDMRPSSPFLPVTTLAQRFSQPWQYQRHANSHGVVRSSTPVNQPPDRRVASHNSSILGQMYQQTTPQRWIRDSSRPPAVPLRQQLAAASRQTQGSNMASHGNLRCSMPPPQTPRLAPTVVSSAVQQPSNQIQSALHPVQDSNTYKELLNAAIPPRQLPFSRQPNPVEPVQELHDDQEKDNSISNRAAQNRSKKRKSTDLEGDERDLAPKKASRSPTNSTACRAVVPQEKVKVGAVKKTAPSSANNTKESRPSKKATLTEGVATDGLITKRNAAAIESGTSTIKANGPQDLMTGITKDPSPSRERTNCDHETLNEMSMKHIEQKKATSRSTLAQQKPSAITTAAPRHKTPGRSRTATKSKTPAKLKVAAKAKAPAKSKAPPTRSETGPEPAADAEPEALMEAKADTDRGPLAKIQEDERFGSPLKLTSSEAKSHSTAVSSPSMKRRGAACEQCRAYKRKCEGTQPACLTCIARKMACTWTKKGANSETAGIDQPAKIETRLADPSTTDVQPHPKAKTTIPPDQGLKVNRVKKQTVKCRHELSTGWTAEPNRASTTSKSSTQHQAENLVDRQLAVTGDPVLKGEIANSTSPALLKIFSGVQDLLAEELPEHQPSFPGALASIQKLEELFQTRLTRGDLWLLADPAVLAGLLTT